MSIATITPPPATSSGPVTYSSVAALAKITVAQYQQLIEAGIIQPDMKVELLDGYLVRKMSKNPPHEGTIDLVKAALGVALPSGWLLRVQQSIQLSESQPEPDVAIARGNARSYLKRHPTPADIGSLIEVANSSLL